MSGRDRARPWWGARRRGDLVGEIEAAAGDGGVGAELAAWVARFGFTVIPAGDQVGVIIAPGSLYSPARAWPATLERRTAGRGRSR